MKVQFFKLLCLVALVEVALSGESCIPSNLPLKIRTKLATNYAEWKIVSPEMLDNDDRDTWIERYSKECPGMIDGDFSNEGKSYILNLLNESNGKKQQQVLYFRPIDDGFKVVVVVPPFEVKAVRIIRRYGPGKYRPFEGNRPPKEPVVIKTDTVGLSDMSAGTVVYFWKNGRFDSVITDE